MCNPSYSEGRCMICGEPLKNGKSTCQCYSCTCVERFCRCEGNTPKTKLKKAFNHLNKKGAGIMERIFNVSS